jgi:hypothetical protein
MRGYEDEPELDVRSEGHAPPLLLGGDHKAGET